MSPKSASSRTWSAATSSTATRTTRRTSARRSCASRTGPRTTRRTRPASWSTTSTSTCARGEIVGIAGLMGAGRTEFAMSLFGQQLRHAASRGKVFKHGKEIKTRTVSEAIDNGIAYATEDRKNYGLNLHRGHQAQHLDGRRCDKLAKRRPRQRQRGVQGRRRVPQEHEHQGAERARRRPASSPAATSRRSCCRSGSTPTPTCSSSTSPPAASTSAPSTRSTRSSTGSRPRARAIIVISSELPELLGICDRIYALSEGRITGELPIEEANPEALLKLMTMEKPR